MKQFLLTEQIAQCLPQTDRTPQLLLRSKAGGARLYTNYPCVTGIAPEEMAEIFNRNAELRGLEIRACGKDRFLHFTLSPTLVNAQIHRMAADFRSAPPALPDEDPTGYLCYVISSLPDTASMCNRTCHDLAILILYLESRPESRPKRQPELIARIEEMLQGRVLSEISQEERQALKAAATMLL